jgi:8-amino-7-oxononanoate synthase
MTDTSTRTSRHSDFLNDALSKRSDNNSLRELSPENDLVDFCSNDYLGFARSQELSGRIAEASSAEMANGSAGSRLISGNTAYAETLENRIAIFHKAEAGLLFNSGYDANLGLFSSVPQRGDTVIYDELCHASIRDGIRLSNATAWNFRHNELAHLADRLKRAEGRVYVAVESIYSMDGDAAPLEAIAALCEKYDAALIVDEAHATGIFGEKGEGLVVNHSLQDVVFARVVTFGKALGVHGAIVLGSAALRKYLINFSRSFIYTTGLPIHAHLAIESAYDTLSGCVVKELKISNLISLFKQKVDALKVDGLIDGTSPIQCFLVPGNARVRRVARAIQEAGFDVRAILSPTVAEGKERLRICLHEFNTEQEIDGLLNAIKKSLENE